MRHPLTQALVTVSYLYCIAAAQHDRGPCKIGLSANPDRRVRQLQTGHPEALDVRYREPVPSERVRHYEQALHHDLSYLRRAGEWFDIDVATAIKQIQFTIIHYEYAPTAPGRAELKRIRNEMRAIVDACRGIGA